MTTPRARIAAALRASNRILIVNHVEPDGDTLGSSLALALALEHMGKTVVVGSDGGVPPAFLSLPGAERVVRQVPPGAVFDAALTMECSTPERCGGFAGAVLATPLIITLDHHESHSAYGHLDDWDPHAAAAAEIVTDLIRELGVPLTPPMSTALLTALATDTGVFRFPKVHPGTLRLAADLMEGGASLTEVVSRVYDQRTLGASRLLGYALLRTVVTMEGAVAYTTLSEAIERAAGAEPDDIGGIVGILRQVQGVRVALLFAEDGPEVRVSIRTRNGVRAHVIAERFGGGGHPGAAGCVVRGDLAAVVPTVLEVVAVELALPGEGGVGWTGS